VDPYVKNTQIYRCPSAPAGKSYGSIFGSGDYTTYALIGGGSPTTGIGLYSPTGRSLANIVSPSATWMLAEAGNPILYYTMGYGFYYMSFSGALTSAGVTTGIAMPEDYTYWLGPNSDSPNGEPPHLEGSNIAYVDGHVKWRAQGANLTGQNWKADPSW
jgi:prepilin-type processing-associated H-X9-DG protein